LERLEARLGIEIVRLEAERGFDFWLSLHNGYLPSPQRRWCTEQMKIRPLEEFIGEDEAVSYIAIRADENRDGYISTKPNIKPVFPFRDVGYIKKDIYHLLESNGIGLPKYYEWRSRSGCFFCFFQRKYEWVMLAEKHPDLFEKAISYEESHKDGRAYTWTQGETLRELIARKDEILIKHEEKIIREREKRKDNESSKLIDIVESILDEEDEDLPCLMCSL
jgi:3'-phosphoadenosine 5'-phosphosulfate sulfotransferase (PAPS reductase)/FAD synthetase